VQSKEKSGKSVHIQFGKPARMQTFQKTIRIECEKLLHQCFFCVSKLVPPMVWIQNQLVGSAVGQKITLECQSEAYPKSINYWMKNDTIITQGECGGRRECRLQSVAGGGGG